MEKELNRNQKSIVDDFILDSELFDKETLRASIITTAGRCEPMFTDPEFFYDCCSYFWSKYKYTFEKWFSALELEYNPLENFSRHETRKFTPGVDSTTTHSGTDTDTHSGTDTDTHSGTDTDTHSGTDTETPSGKVTITNDTERGQNVTVETKVSSYDDNNYLPKEQVITTPGANQKDSTTQTTEYDDAKTEYEHGEVIETAHGHVIETEHGEVIETAHGHVITETKDGHDDTKIDITGNNGVSFGKLIDDELKTASFPIYQKITDIFCLELLITVY